MIKVGHSGMHEAKNISWSIGKVPEIKPSQVKSELQKVLTEYYKKHSSPYIGSKTYSISCGTVDLTTGLKGSEALISGRIFIHGEIIADGEVANDNGLVVKLGFSSKVYEPDGSVDASEVNRIVSALIKAREKAIKAGQPADEFVG